MYEAFAKSYGLDPTELDRKDNLREQDPVLKLVRQIFSENVTRYFSLLERKSLGKNSERKELIDLENWIKSESDEPLGFNHVCDCLLYEASYIKRLIASKIARSDFTFEKRSSHVGRMASMSSNKPRRRSAKKNVATT